MPFHHSPFIDHDITHFSPYGLYSQLILRLIMHESVCQAIDDPPNIRIVVGLVVDFHATRPLPVETHNAIQISTPLY